MRAVAVPPEHTGEQAAGLAALGRRLDGIETMLERVWGDLDFIRNRLSCYIGDGIALTYLLDQTPMFVNCNDFGCPVNLIDGGRYEEENLAVLLSFVTPDTVFVDVGANVGFYTVEIARRLTGNGRAYAFEPHPKLIELLRRNAFVNGLAPVVSSFSFALSDRNGPADLQYPTGHLGGGQVSAPGEIAGHTMVKSELKKLDDLLGRDFRCDLVKIDVEGHELNVLNGMRESVGNSPRIKILFEKLVPNIGNEAGLEQYFAALGFALYAVGPDASLAELAAGGLRGWGGYVLAAPRGLIDGDALNRSRFSIYARQLWRPPALPATSEASPDEHYRATAPGALLFHGPYWFLKRGRWRFKLHGRVRGAVTFSLLERFGYTVSSFSLEAGQTEQILALRRDLVHFECAAYAVSGDAEIDIDRIEFIREG
ncbi:MAG: FkbM family methyltransferase [Stellaceae bacterium]